MHGAAAKGAAGLIPEHEYRAAVENDGYCEACGFWRCARNEGRPLHLGQEITHPSAADACGTMADRKDNGTVSDTNDTEKKTETKARKAREPKKNSIPTAEIKAMTDGISEYSKAAFIVVGHKNGVRAVYPKTAGVSRFFFYGDNDYSLIPDHAAIKVLSEAERKEQHKGGIMAEVDFSQGLDLAREAIQLLIDVVRKAPAPAVAPAKAKATQASDEAMQPQPEGEPQASTATDAEA